MAFVSVALIVAFIVTLLAIRINLGHPEAHRRFVQRRRTARVRQTRPRGFARAGGIGIAAGLPGSMLARLIDAGPIAKLAGRTGVLLLASAAPVIAAGPIEDFFARLGIGIRFGAALASAAMAGVLLDEWVARVDFQFPDRVIMLPAVAMVLTRVAVAGLTNAFNIVDWFNGLASGVATLILIGIAYIAFKVHDVAVLAGALTALGAIVGFILPNLPRDLIYLGDGGAYLIGFLVAESLVLLVARNPTVSPWFLVLLCSYPVYETLFSIYRRVVLRGDHPGAPDVARLHHLIYIPLVRWAVCTHLSVHRVQRNALPPRIFGSSARLAWCRPFFGGRTARRWAQDASSLPRAICTEMCAWPDFAHPGGR